MTPAVSVVMCAHRGGEFFRQALESVLGQDFTDFELILVDDSGPGDALAEAARLDDPRVLHVRNGRNLGLTRSLNAGLAHARAPLTARMDADDVSLPHRLGEQRRFMQAHPGVGLLGGQADCIDAQGRVLFRERHPTGEALLRWLMHFINPFWHPSVMMRTDLLRRVGGYDESLPYAQDFDLFRRLAAAAPVAQMEEPVLLYRIHEQGLTQKSRREQDQCAARVIRRAVRGLMGREPSDALIAGARGILFRLPVVHAGPESAELLCASAEAFAASQGLRQEGLAPIRQRLSADLAHLAARHPAAAAWAGEAVNRLGALQ